MRDKDNINTGNSQHPLRFLYNKLHQTATSRRTPELKHTVVPSNCSHRETVTAAFAWHYVKDNKPSQNWTCMKHHAEVSTLAPCPSLELHQRLLLYVQNWANPSPMTPPHSGDCVTPLSHRYDSLVWALENPGIGNGGFISTSVFPTNKEINKVDSHEIGAMK